METSSHDIRVAQLESYSNELTLAVKSLASHSRSTTALLDPNNQFPVDAAAHDEVHRAQASILAHVAKIKSLVSGPTDFLAHLASQVDRLLHILVHSEDS
jgi:hypothetical protein